MTTPAETRHLRITGRVQGVWYRGWTQATARALGLRGWVQNDPDGSVRALLHGPPEAVAQMITAMQDGPPGARVDGVADAPATDPQIPERFEVRR